MFFFFLVVKQTRSSIQHTAKRDRRTHSPLLSTRRYIIHSRVDANEHIDYFVKRRFTIGMAHQ
jgi:hypothetical protein